MPELSSVSDTLYVPLLGRIYASKHQSPIERTDEMAMAIICSK